MIDMELLPEFIAEAGEHLDEMEANLIRLEEEPENREIIDDIFRDAHTIKGSSAYLGLKVTSELAHKLENLLEAVRQGELEVNSALIDTLISGKDRMALLIDDVAKNHEELTDTEDILADILSYFEQDKKADAEEAKPEIEEQAFADDEVDQVDLTLDDVVDLSDAPAADGVDAAGAEADDLELGVDELFADEDTADEAVKRLAAELEEESVVQDEPDEQLAAAEPDALDDKPEAADDQVDEPALSDDAGEELTLGLDEMLPDEEAAADEQVFDEHDDIAAKAEVEYEAEGASRNAAGDELTLGLEEMFPDDDDEGLNFDQDEISPGAAQAPDDEDELSFDLDEHGGIAAESDWDGTDEAPVDEELSPIGDISPVDHDESWESDTVEIGEVYAQEEEDEELYTIFIEQLKSNLLEIRDIALQIPASENRSSQIELINERIHELQASANYMGYEKLGTFYDGWQRKLEGYQERFFLNEAPALEEILENGVNIYFDAIMKSFEKLEGVERLSVSDDVAVEQDHGDYDEQNDTELFVIFLEQIRENFAKIEAVGVKFDGAEDPSEGVAEIRELVVRMRAAANYMGYEKLTDIYDEWLKDIEDGVKDGLKDDCFEHLGECVKKYLSKITEIFPPLAEKTDDEAEEAVSVEPAETVGGETADESEIMAAEKPSALPSELELMGEPELDGGAGEETLKDRMDELLSYDDLGDDSGDFYDPLADDLADGLAADEGAVVDRLSSALDSALGIGGKTPSLPDDEVQPLDLELPSEPAIQEPAIQEPVLAAAVDETKQKEAEVKPPAEAKAAVQEVKPPAETKSKTADREVKPPVETEVKTADAGESKQPKPPAEDGAAEDEKSAAAAKTDLEKRVEKRREEMRKSGSKQAADISDREKVLRQSLRIDAAKIDELLNQAGELVINRAWFSQLYNEMRRLEAQLQHNPSINKKYFKEVRGFSFKLNEAIVALGRVANDLQESVMKVRMLPISQLFNRYPRLIRDLVHGTDKDVRLEIMGADTELDKMIIEEIADPLVHVIRNAVDHGIETVAERQRLGKNERGLLKLDAYHEGSHVVIEVEDDGKGLEPEVIKAIALEKNLVTPDQLARMSYKEIIELIMRPGFSTAAKITRTSGRGVGMDVVRKNLENLNGTLEIDSSPGEGTRFRIKIPLTLAVIKALLVNVGGALFTIPLIAVDETLRVRKGEINSIKGNEVIYLRDSAIPLIRLSGVFNLASSARAAENERPFVVIVSSGSGRVGLVVDDLRGQEEVVIKPLPDYLRDNKGFSGATILGDGRISLILDIHELVNLTIGRQNLKIGELLPMTENE